MTCNGSVKWFPGGALFVLAGWRVRVFGLSGLVDKPYDRLSIWTIFLSRFMDRIYRYRLGTFVNVKRWRKIDSSISDTYELNLRI